MLQPKQGARVRISSHEKVINVSDVYIRNDSLCSCIQCDSTCCFSHRNSGLPCTCTDCDPNKCLTWEVKKDESKQNNEKRNYVSPEISKDSLSVPESILKFSAIRTKKYTERPINATGVTRKEKISLLNLGNDTQNYTFYDPELKEVFTEEEKPIWTLDSMEKLRENKNMNSFEIKDTSSNENSDIIECNTICLEKDLNDFENKEFYSKIKISLPQNKSAYPDTKKSLTRKTGNCCSQKNSTDNTKSDLSEVYEIYTNEKRNIVKCSKICKDLENKYTDKPENKQDKPENKIKCKDNEDVQNNKSNLEINTRMKITNIKCDREHPTKDKTSDIDSRNCTKYTYKDLSHSQNKINMNKNNKSYEKYVSRLQSVAMSYARPDYENSRAQLSAQIMNVPYEDFKDSLSRKQSPTESTINSSNKYDRMDIFTRLKEIYKACSCRVCECIGGESLCNRSENCNCDPCDCDDCHGYMAKLQEKIHYAPEAGCPCVKCDRKNCSGIVKKTTYAACDCKLYDSIKCSESFSIPCSCAPCQCDKCKSSIFMPQMLKVSNAAETFRQNNCDCEPCECTKCTTRYSAMTSNIMRPVSTGLIIYGNCNCEECPNSTCQLGRSDCRCDSQYKVIRKPIAKKNLDFDMHRVYDKKDKYEKNTITNNNRNMIAMFALSNNHPPRLFKNSNKKRGCECDVCECIVCEEKGKGSISNKSIKIVIDKPNRDFYAIPLKRTECSSCACQSCNSLQAENVEGKFCVKTGYDACNCKNSKHMGFNFKIINKYGNYNIKSGKPTYSTFQNKCMCKLRDCPECNHLVNAPLRNFLDTDESCLDGDKFYLLKKGMLLTPSMFEKKGLASDSSNIHIKPEKYSIRENDLRKKILTNEQNTKLCPKKLYHNCLSNDYKESIRNESPKSDIKVRSTNSLFMNMASKEVGTNEIYKINSVDFKKGNVSTVFFEHSRSNVQNDRSNTILLDAGLTHMIPKQSSHCNNKKLQYNKDLNKYNETPSLDKQEVENLSYKTKSSSNNDIHFSSTKSMSLVKLLCNERNLKKDNINSIDFLQSIERIPLNRLKMYEENESYTWDKTLNEGNIFDNSGKDNYSYSINNNLLIDMNHDKLDTFNCEKKKLETGLIKNNYDIHDKDIVKVPVPETTKQIKPKEKETGLIETNYDIHAKGIVRVPVPETTKQIKPKEKETGLIENNYDIHAKGIVRVPVPETTKQIKPKEKETGLIENNYDIHDKGIVKVPVPETTKQIKPKEKETGLIETNYDIHDKGIVKVPVPETTKQIKRNEKETGLIETNYDIHDKGIVKVPVPETTKQIKPKEKSALQMVVRKPKNYNINIKAKESAGQPKTNKSRSKTKVANNNMKNKIENHSKDIVDEVNTKRNLEIPDVINTATSVVNFNEFDRRIDFEKSFKLFREVNFSNGEIKKPSSVLRKNFFFSLDVGENKRMWSSIPMSELDVNNDEKSTSVQKNTIFPYCPETDFGNNALTKLQNEVNELLCSPLLQTNIQTEQYRSKSKLNSELNMSDATSQTKRKTIIVDKEINCDMPESREKLRQSIQNFINMMLTDVVQHKDIEIKEQNLIRDFNVSSLNGVNSNFVGLKASFVGLRKISDHSVLIKWTIPQDLNNIQGYELQIDGRPVKRILNPSRRMAVLKCLPHSEKLLLTIRTITNLQPCRSPVTTIVYNPNSKE